MPSMPISELATVAGMGWGEARREELARIITVRAALPAYQDAAFRLFNDPSMPGSTARAILLRLFAGQLVSPFTVRNLRRRNFGGLRNDDALRQAVALLAGMGFLWSERTGLHGRAVILWHVNAAAFRIPSHKMPGANETSQ